VNTSLCKKKIVLVIDKRGFVHYNLSIDVTHAYNRVRHGLLQEDRTGFSGALHKENRK
jgi:hypothetical protein